MAVVDFVISIATKVAEYLVEPAIHEVKYFLCANDVIEDLGNEKGELSSERDHLQDRVKQAKEKAEEVEKPVEIWLNDVNKLLDEAADLEQRMRANTSCFQGRCPTWRRYRLCKQMARKIEAIGKLKGKRNIHPFSHRAPLPGIQYESSENFTYFESTKVAYNQLLEALQDDRICKIGVYGMGGCGKTTLVTEVGKMAEEQNLFEKVISIAISQTPKIRDIQGKMADMLSLKLEEESDEGRAQRLWMCLKEKKRVLIIVDDLWGEVILSNDLRGTFKLSSVGICLDNNYKGGCKILITTRRQEVCDSMDCQKKIHLGLLSKDESWTLFRKQAKIDDHFSKSLNDVPRKLCDECKGLAIAIVTVGSSLKGKRKAEWEVALHSLKHSETIDDYVEGGVRMAFSCLKLSYDYLQNREAKLLFLMCSLFPEDHEIMIEDLIRYGVGLGLGGRFSLELARSHIEAAINKLLDSCLLMHGTKNKEQVKMHDMVRDVALWIAKRSDDQKMLINLDMPLGVLAENNNVRDYFAISSLCKENQISFQWKAPNLEVLLLNSFSQNSLDLSHAAFEGMEGLKVFSLMIDVHSIPLSLPLTTPLLTSLRTLRLNGWRIGNLSFILNLTTLEVLDLQRCILEELPNEIGKLERLKLLDLSGCAIKGNYNGAIGKCLELEELYFSRFFSPEYISQSIVDIGALPKLTRFAIQNSRSKLMMYIASLSISMHAGSRRSLALDNFNISNLEASKRNVLQMAETVELRDLRGGCKNVVPDMTSVVGGMNDLISLFLDGCAEIECIFDTTSDSHNVSSLQGIDALVPKLVHLKLCALENLKELYRGPTQHVLHFFEKLEKLEIGHCRQLSRIFPLDCDLQNLKFLKLEFPSGSYMEAEVLFSMSVSQGLQQLEELSIVNCHKLKHIISNVRQHGSNRSKDIVPASTNSHFVMTNLKKLSISFCPELECIFPVCYAEGFPQLQEIKISSHSNLKYIFGECDYEDHSPHQKENIIMFPHLEVFILKYLVNLVGICPENYQPKWPSRRKLTVDWCPKLTTSWIAMMAGAEKKQQHLDEKFVLCKYQQQHFPSKLQKLKLKRLPQLNLISWMGPTPEQILNLQYLQHLKVANCENLKSLFSVVVHRSLPELISLTIKNCEELEQIFYENEQHEHLSNAEVMLPKLAEITVYNCNKLKRLFSVSMITMLSQLRILKIKKAAQLEEAFRHGSEGTTMKEMEIVLPNLVEIKLVRLPNFLNICQGFKLQDVKLQRLYVEACPKIPSGFEAIQVQLDEANDYEDFDSDITL